MAYSFDSQSIAGKNVLLSGGTTGIGRTTAYRLVAAGANVLISGTDPQHLQDALADIESGTAAFSAAHKPGKVYGILADQSKKDDVERVFQEVDTKLGSLDILVNNAALSAESILDTDYATMEKVVQTNLLGYMHCCRHAIERFEKKGEGHIVNIGSLSAKERNEGSDIYVATKSGIDGFSESLRKQVNKKGVKVTLIEPGLVGTDMTASKVPVEEQPKAEAEGTMLKAEEIAESVYYALIQPRRCHVILIQIRPDGEAI